MTDTHAPRRDELRLYSVFRSDIPLTREAALALHGAGYAALAAACDEARARTGTDPAAGYDPMVQPKVVLRARAERDIQDVIGQLESEGRLFVATEDDAGRAVAVHLVPCRRADLPPAMARMQLFSNPSALIVGEPGRACRADIAGAPPGGLDLKVAAAAFHPDDVPLGKMLAQVGHAVWTAACLLPRPRSVCVASLPLAALPQLGRMVGETGGPVVDAGRTVFDRPTTTAVWTTDDHVPGWHGPEVVAALPRTFGLPIVSEDALPRWEDIGPRV